METVNVDKTTDVYEQLVVFRLGNEDYGVGIDLVNTIIRMPQITIVPKAPEFVEGVINLRGLIIPVIDLRKRLDLQVGELTHSARIAVVEAAGSVIGMIVDAVTETVSIPIAATEPPSPVLHSVDTRYIRAIGKMESRLLILLDLDEILTGNEFETAVSLSKVNEAATTREAA